MFSEPKVMRNHILIILSLLLLTLGCANSRVNSRLDAAESLMEQHPDSALTILQAIDGSTLRGESRARHALLLSQALDKNYIDVTSDSLISIATDYYANSNDDYHKMLAYHYRSRIFYNADHYNTALIDALTAYDHAVELSDTLNMSRIESQIASIYVMGYNEVEALSWELLSLEHAKQLYNYKWLTNSYLNIGKDLLGMLRIDEAIQYADSSLALSSEPGLIAKAQEIKYLSYFYVGDSCRADSIYRILLQLDYEMSDNVIASRKHLEPLSKDEQIKHKDAIIEQQNDYILAMSLSNLSETRQRFDREKATRLEMSVEQQRKKIIFLLFISGVIIVSLIIFIRYIRIRSLAHNLEKENQVQAIIQDYEKLKYNYNLSKIKVGELNHNVETLYQQSADSLLANENLKQKISLIFLKQYSWINKFGELYLDSTLSLKRNHELIKQLESNFSINNPRALIAEIEKRLSESNADLLREIHNLGFNDTDRGMLYFFILGISTRVICLITDKSPASVYNIKSRLKKKLQQLDSPFTNQIINII